MSLFDVFKWPALIAACTMFGLIAGLVSDGWGDIAAGVGLALPAALSIGFGLRGR
jgi:hypothetical protein